MQVSNPNNINIYNLSHGKSLPEFISEKKRRSLLKKDLDLQRRIELIQDFEMPTISNKIKMSPDQQYIFATGTYKPRVRCYDVKDLSMKFERCIDCEVVTFCILSEDYSKTVFLLEDRNVEFHTPQGTHFKIRFPKFGRDMAYHHASCDLMLVGAGSEIYRLNLDQGRFLKSFQTHSKELTKCVINDEHHFIMSGGIDGHVECWDPRSKARVGILDTSLGLVNSKLSETPYVSCLEFNDALQLAVGTSSGHVLLYDVRGNKPFTVKDHLNELPIHSIAFSKTNEMVISSDKRSVKLWDEHTGDAITAVELKTDINDIHVVDGSGLFFLANESPKICTYFIPMLGPAPRWCSFLDNLTEELEEQPVQQIYDDYKFLTLKEMESLGLSNLIGSNLIRAYMHGYFIDMKLYNKAVAVANPFAYKEYRRQKISEKIEESCKSRVEMKKKPKVNEKLAERLSNLADMRVTNSKRKQQKKVANELLGDSRFKAIFEDPNFQVDEQSEEFLSIFQNKKKQRTSNEGSTDKMKAKIRDGESSSSDDDDEVESKVSKLPESHANSDDVKMFSVKSDFLKSGKSLSTLHDLEELGGEETMKYNKKTKLRSIEERIKDDTKTLKKNSNKQSTNISQLTFELDESDKKKTSQDRRKHISERKHLRRPLSREMRTKKKRPAHARH